MLHPLTSDPVIPLLNLTTPNTNEQTNLPEEKDASIPDKDKFRFYMATLKASRENTGDHRQLSKPTVPFDKQTPFFSDLNPNDQLIPSFSSSVKELKLNPASQESKKNNISPRKRQSQATVDFQSLNKKLKKIRLVTLKSRIFQTFLGAV